MRPPIDWDAREAAILREMETLDRLYPASGLLYQAERVLIRSARIVAGAVIGFGAIIAYTATPEVAHAPLSSLTLMRIFGAVVGFLGTLALAWWACTTAFGAGPDVKNRHRLKATTKVDSLARQYGGRY